MMRFEEISSINAAIVYGHKIVNCSFTLYTTWGWCWEALHCCWMACTMLVEHMGNH